VVRQWHRDTHDVRFVAAPGNACSPGGVFSRALSFCECGRVHHRSATRNSCHRYLDTGRAVKEFAILLCIELGIMGIITPFADAASPIYANSGYLPAGDYWRLGTIFGAIFLGVLLLLGVPWAGILWAR